MSALDPATWDPHEVAALLAALSVGPKPRVRGRRHVVSAHHPLSAFAGLQALRRGGTAADAGVAMTALDTVVLPGASSLGGTLALVYHDTAAGRTYALNAGLTAPLQDSAPRDGSDRQSAGPCWCRA